ncbi:hypothetical protein V8C37DRAFT_75790 [Trichoderma ceciliae]
MMEEPGEMPQAQPKQGFVLLLNALQAYDWISDPDGILLPDPSALFPFEQSYFPEFGPELQLDLNSDLQGNNFTADSYNDEYSDTTSPPAQMDSFGFSSTFLLQDNLNSMI